MCWLRSKNVVRCSTLSELKYAIFGFTGFNYIICDDKLSSDNLDTAH